MHNTICKTCKKTIYIPLFVLQGSLEGYAYPKCGCGTENEIIIEKTKGLKYYTTYTSS